MRKLLLIPLMSISSLMLASGSTSAFSSLNYRDSVYIMNSYSRISNEGIEYLQNNIKYPLLAMYNGIEGKVKLKLYISCDGSISEIKTIEGIGYGCEEEAINVIRRMPKWSPAIFKGQPVESSRIVLIDFYMN